MSEYSITLGPDHPQIPPESPQRPPLADDRTFVLDTDANLDAVCRFRDGGSITINIPVTRYAGPTLADGTLSKIDELLVSGLAAEYAELQVMAWDVDYAAARSSSV